MKLVGYDATEVKSGKRAKNAALTEDSTGRYNFRYPLVEWDWSREDCKAVIASEGLIVPVKSACFFCPNQSTCELRTMSADNPELFLRALLIEEVAFHGKHAQKRRDEGLKVQTGLWRRDRKSDGRSGSWVVWAQDENLLADAELRAGTTLAELFAAAKPELWASLAPGAFRVREGSLTA